MISNADKIRAFDDVFYELLGGREVVVGIVRNHQGESVREIARSMNLPRTQFQTKITRAKIKLRQLKLMPKGWEIPVVPVG